MTSPAEALAALAGRPALPVEERRRLLAALADELGRRALDCAAAAAADFGRRSETETLLADVLIVIDAARYARRRVRRWARWRGCRVPYPFWPARAWLEPVPKGVVGIMAPWNYPFQLALMPAVDAIAAGNRVAIKPSEHTPRCAGLLAEIIAAAWGPEIAQVVIGDAAVAVEFAAQPWDHLVFTGGTAAGRRVAVAAAAHLTPVTLELGGKCPALVLPRADLARAARQILLAKKVNAGQTCVAPDTVLLVGHSAEAFRSAARAVDLGPAETAVINALQQARLDRLAEGALLTPLSGGLALAEAPPDHPLHHEEIFGPLLALRACADLAEAIDIIARGPAPLAVYLFGATEEEEAEVAERTKSGALVIGRAVEYAGFHTLPFGGVGASGHGRRNAEAGFLEFSHLRARVRHGPFSLSRLFDPPRSDWARRLTRRLVGLPPR